MAPIDLFELALGDDQPGPASLHSASQHLVFARFATSGRRIIDGSNVRDIESVCRPGQTFALQLRSVLGAAIGVMNEARRRGAKG